MRLTPVPPATWLLLVWGLLGVVCMHLRPDMCPCQEERDARHVAATMEEVAAAMEELLSDLDALITLDYLFFFGPCAQVQCSALVPARCCVSI